MKATLNFQSGKSPTKMHSLMSWFKQ